MPKPGSCHREEGVSWNGLALCRRVVAAGDVSVAGASPGRGAEHPVLVPGASLPAEICCALGVTINP